MGINLTNFFHFKGPLFPCPESEFCTIFRDMEIAKNEVQIVRHKKAVISYNGKGFLKVVLSDDAEISKDDVVEQRKITSDLTGNKPHVVLAITGRRTSATKEAREYSASNIPEGRVAEAILIKSLPVRLMGKFFINFHKPTVPTKMFDSESEAMLWLNQRLFESGVS